MGYEYTNGSAKRFYYAGGTRIALRPASDNVARWLLTDHLGSTAQTVSSNGTGEGEQRYMPFGLDRHTSGSLNTAYRYTGQRIESNTDLYFYNSRWYDPIVGRFIQPDTIVPEPGNPQSLNRYSYVLNNPVKYTDPSGHVAWVPFGAFGGAIGGAIYGYGPQVADNLNQDKDLWQALTTDIDPNEVGFWTGTGAIIGTGLGISAIGVEAAFGSGTISTLLTAGTRASIGFLSRDPDRVKHIMRGKHAWERIIQLTDDVQQNYANLQPYLTEVMSTVGTQVDTTEGGLPVMKFVKMIDGEQVVVIAIQIADDVLQITNAWVKTQ